MHQLIVPFAEKDAAKSSGCKWSTADKCWYAPELKSTHEKWLPVFLDVPFCDKDEAKQKGCIWDTNKRKWCINKGNYTAEFHKWIEKRKIYLDIPFDFKEILKEDYGGKWDGLKQKWYVYDGCIDEVLAQYTIDCDGDCDGDCDDYMY